MVDEVVEPRTIREIRIETLGSGHRKRWDEYVTRCPEATFFHLSGWQSIIENTFGHRTFFLFAEDNQGICGVLPLAEVKSRLFGHSLCSLPFCVYGGIAADSASARVALDNSAQKLASELGVEHLEYRSIRSQNPDWAHRDLYVTFRKEIHSDPEFNLKNIPRKQRAMVRKGIKGGLRSDLNQDVDSFFHVYSDNVHRHGTPALPRRYFAAVKDTFGEDCELLAVRSSDGKLVSSVMSFYFRDQVLPYYAGDLLSARDLAANDFKYWEVMQRATARGSRVFDYGRSKVGTGSYHFKKNWGFEPTPLQYAYKLYKLDRVPEVNPLNPKYRFFIETWKRMPRYLVNAISPHLVKYLG